MKKLLSIDVNTEEKARKIVHVRKGFYEKFYGFNTERIYTVFYKPKELKPIL